MGGKRRKRSVPEEDVPASEHSDEEESAQQELEIEETLCENPKVLEKGVLAILDLFAGLGPVMAFKEADEFMQPLVDTIVEILSLRQWFVRSPFLSCACSHALSPRAPCSPLPAVICALFLISAWVHCVNRTCVGIVLHSVSSPTQLGDLSPVLCGHSSHSDFGSGGMGLQNCCLCSSTAAAAKTTQYFGS